MTRKPDHAKWLSHLRHDRRGLPVPYINMWGPERTENSHVRYDPHVGGPGVFVDDDDETVPDFTRQAPQRQRECVLAGLCQVCGRPVHPKRRCLILSGISVKPVIAEGQQLMVVIEPWLDLRCAEIALFWCPALLRRTAEADMTIVMVPDLRQVRFIQSVHQLNSHPGQPAVMWVKIALPDGLFGTAA